MAKIKKDTAKKKAAVKTPPPLPGIAPVTNMLTDDGIYGSYFTTDDDGGMPVLDAPKSSKSQLAHHKSINQLNTFEKMTLIKNGVSKAYLESLKSKASLDYDQLARALAVTRATLINKKGDERFSYTISEKIVSLADIYAFGYAVFEDVAKFNSWVFIPNRALGNMPPYNLLDNQFGREEVKNLIGRIAYGVYS